MYRKFMYQEMHNVKITEFSSHILSKCIYLKKRKIEIFKIVTIYLTYCFSFAFVKF